MPELPEVQTFTDYFNKNALNQAISDIEFKDTKLIRNVSAQTLKKELVGKKFSKAHRRGKFTIVDIKSSDYKLIIHYGMSGSLDYQKSTEATAEDKKYSQVTFIFKDGYSLFWLDKRLFGSIYLVTDINQVSTIKNMGPDALSLTQAQFLKLLDEHQTKNIKTFLMDQSNIAGIGNEYSNEILYQAKILPTRSISDLSLTEKKKLYATIEKVLKKALTIDTIDHKYPSNWLLANKRKMICPGDPTHKLVKKTIGGRSAYYCPTEQK